jgi:hypothetical protein
MKSGNRANHRRSGRLSRWARLAVAAATIALLLANVGGATAASRERTGDRIDLLTDPPTTYPASTAFYIWHGFIFESGDGGRGHFEFQLEVDGVLGESRLRRPGDP